MTQQNTFIRKFGKLAIIITVTDWEDFKELEASSKHAEPDLLISSFTSKDLWSNFNTQLTLSTRGEVRDITDQTAGTGLASILLGSSLAGPLWAYRKMNGLTAKQQFSYPQI